MFRAAGSRVGWFCIAFALVLIAVRRSVTLARTLSDPVAFPGDPVAETVAFFVSLFTVYGLYRLHPSLKAMQRTKEELEIANRKLLDLDRLKSDFLATVSHEFRTPVAAVNGAVENLLKGIGGDLSPKQKAMIGIMLRNNARLGRLVDNLLDITQIESGRFSMMVRPIDLRAPVQLAVDSMASVAEHAGRRVSYRAPDHPVSVKGDHDRIVQITVNLLDNAIRFASREVHIILKKDGDWVRVIVENDGVEIEPEMRTRIFQRFTRGPSGPVDGHVGLGLSIVRALAEAHGGTAIAENRAGAEHGVRMTVSLPLEAGA
jgi:signal transduction histidine kinase